MPRRSNVVLVVLESQRSAARLPPGTTPFLDGLAGRGVVVEQMLAVVPHTNRALVPILCGIPPRIQQGFAPEVPGACLPALLGPHGYASAFFTTATLEFERKGDLLRDMGFEAVHGGELHEGGGFARVNYFGWEDRALVAPALAWVDRTRAAGNPFVLALLTLTPHHPYRVPAAARRRSRTTGDPQAAYLDALAYVDATLAELWAGFEQRGLLDDTLFVFVGDHGEAFGEHGMRFHSAVIWEEALHVQALLVHPGVLPAGGRIAGPRDHTDLVPTIAALLGFRLEGGSLPGRSLLEPPPERALYHATWIDNQAMALRRGTRKWVYHYRRRPVQLFDLGADPAERHDLGAALSPEEADAIELELLRWRRRVNERYG
jgi:arylsulfatase A-like enzyme